MSELGSSAAVGIEGVEWLDAGSGNLTVRVTGRWRRRRSLGGSEFRTPAVLVVEAEGRRHRFPAMPDPPSLAGAAPGTWRLSFSVPGELAPRLGGHAYLTLGTVTVALPVPESGIVESRPPTTDPIPAAEAPVAAAPAAEAPPPADAAPTLPATSPAPPASLEIERAWQRADEAESSAAALGDRIEELERELTHERDRRELAVLEEQQRRDADAERDHAEAARLRAEAGLRDRRRASARVPMEPSAVPPVPEPVVRSGGEGLPDDDLVGALRRELAMRVSTEAGLRARLVQAESQLAARVLLQQRTDQTLSDLRLELQALREALARERAARRRAEAEASRLRAQNAGRRDRSRDVSVAIAEIRGTLEELRAAGEVAPPAPGRDESDPQADPAGTVTPERLSDALARLRAAQEPRQAPDDTGEPSRSQPVAAIGARTPGLRTLDGAFRRLVRTDAERAGVLVLALLGAQHVAYPYPIAYDLVLGTGRGCVQVTVGDGAPTIVVSGAARAREQVDFQIVGDPTRLARRLVAGPLRRWLGFGVARVRGRRDGIAALQALLSLPADLLALTQSGMRVAPETLLALVAAMIDPQWTRGERFAIACATPDATAYLQIRDGAPPLATRAAPEGRIAVTLRGSGRELALGLAGGEPGAVGDRPRQLVVDGDESALAVLRRWINRAQSD